MPLQRKKLDALDLRVGMKVVELDRPWLETPFLFQGFEIRSDADIAEIQRYCRYVYVVVAEPDTAPARHAATHTAPRHKTIEMEQTLLKINNRPGASTWTDRVHFEDELPRAREIYRETSTLARDLMNDAHIGHSLDIPGAKKVVTDMVESVLRNPDALACFAQLKHKEHYTAEHSLRVSILALTFGRHLGFDREQLELLGIGALLHDIGKTRVPDAILSKPGPLTDLEKQTMRQHVPWGVEILEQAPGIPTAAVEVVRHHHERYSGGGYAAGLKGDAIGTFGLIGGIVDCYDAISSDRHYRAGLSAHETLKHMYEWRENWFHPQLVEQFIQCMGIYPIGSVVELNTGEVGVVVALNRARRLKPQVALVLDAGRVQYATASFVDLAASRTADGRAREIEHVVAPGAYRIDPAQYLPVH
jgi:putative nucleotidyltransferase with HDIG domain